MKKNCSKKSRDTVPLSQANKRKRRPGTSNIANIYFQKDRSSLDLETTRRKISHIQKRTIYLEKPREKA
jgi:hypothetical protein